MKIAKPNGTPPRSKYADFARRFDSKALHHGLTNPIKSGLDYRVQAIIDLMAGNLCGQHSLDDLARQVNLSSSRFSHLFKVETGLTPMLYLKQLRLERMAELLLKHPYQTVNQIQGEVGMQHESHFYHDFKRTYGLTPLEFRQRYLAASSKEGKEGKEGNESWEHKLDYRRR